MKLEIINKELYILIHNFMIDNDLTKEEIIKYLNGFIDFERGLLKWNI